MSIHPSLKVADTMKRHRSVLSRLERIRILQERGTLDPENHSILGLPKVKHLKIRIKKEKTSAAAEGSTPMAGATPETPPPAGGTGTKRPGTPAGSGESPKPKK